jgi:hypothetical protein
MRTTLLAIGFVMAHIAAVGAQELSALRLEVERLARETQTERSDLIAELRDNLWKAVYLSPGQADTAEILTFRRADIQSGAGAGASGSTSAVLSPLLPAIFGMAFENGALTRTVSGTTITLKAVPVHLLCASRPGAAPAIARREDDGCRTFWNRLGITASFDTTRGEKKAQLENLETLKSQFTDLTARVELVNRRKATGAAYVGAFEQKFKSWKQAAAAFAELDLRTEEVQKAESELEASLTTLVESAEWKTAGVEQRIRIVENQIKATVAMTVVPTATAQQIRNAWLAALRADVSLQNAIANAPVLTAEYGLQQPDVAVKAIGTIVPAGSRPPRLHSGRVIYAQGWADSGLDLIANVSVTVFDEVRMGMRGRFRDFRTGIEAKLKLRDVPNYGTPTLSFAGLYTFLNQEPLGLGLVAFNEADIRTRGHIGLFQTKLEFPTGRNAVRIPISFTYSNRTELIKESEVRGQIGVSFNLDAVFAAPR